MKLSRKKLISAIVSLSFASLLAFLTIFFFTDYSLGWYSENRYVQSRGIGITVESQSAVTTLSCYAFRYDGMFGAVCLDVSNNPEIAMSEYDVIFTDKNVNTPLFFRVVAQGIPNTEGGYISVTIPCTTPNYSQSSNTITAGDGLNAQGVLSNVITCKLGCGLIENARRVTDSYFPVETSETRVEDNVSIFTGVRDLMKPANASANKVVSGKYINNIQKDNDGNITSASKTTTAITLTLNYEDYADYLCGVELDEDGIVTDYDYEAEEKDCLVFYIEIDYDDDLVNMFRSHTSEDTLAEFRNDIGTISIKEVWG
ncbi:hypothetical protein IKQ02_00210 [bacterium]|nr:hypothetical protein [bacterium]